MYILLILFSASLIGIIVMIGRKLELAKNGQIPESYYSHPFIPDIQKIKYLTFRSLKKYGHLGLVTTIRYYIRSTNFLKNKYQEIKTKVKNLNIKSNHNGNLPEKVEENKFLKMISEYKNKIRKIKHRVIEEENNL